MKMSYPHCASCDNRNCFINRFVSNTWKQQLGDVKSTQIFKTKQQIIFEGSSVLGLHFIYSGKVKVFKSHGPGNYRILRLSRTGEVLGHRGFGSDMQYPISAVALDDSCICFIPNDEFFKALKANPELSYQMMVFFADELRKAEVKVFDFIKLPVKSRMAGVLLYVQDIFKDPAGGSGQGFRFPKKDLANMAVTTYETTLRTLVELEEEKAVVCAGKVIQITDTEKLKALAFSPGTETAL